MEIVLVVIAVLVVASVALGYVATRRRDGAPELEPPGAGGVAVEAPPAEAVEPGVEAEGDLVLEAPPEPAVEEVAPAVVEAPPAPPAVKPSLRERLAKARSVFVDYLPGIRARSGIDQQSWDDLEEALVRADVGVATTADVLDAVRKRVDNEGIGDPEGLLTALKDELRGRLVGDRTLRYEPGQPNVWLFVGVNGVGKTTTIGKVARRCIDEGRSVVVAAGDTFRAAAAEQLEQWAERVGADVVRGAEGGDPSSIIFDAVQRAAARGHDLVLADTAGRLHTKTNLMEELRKVRRVADREPGKLTEVLLVLDATVGQNGLVQARQFTEAVDVTGVVLTKLDGSAKGGIVVAIQAELGLPVKLVGLGETADDLVAFDPDEFVEALLT